MRVKRGKTGGPRHTRGMRPARAASEVRSRDDDVAALHFLRPGRIDGLERVFGEDLRIRRAEVLARDDVVRGDVIAKRPHATLETGLHGQTFRGSVIFPRIADAATVHGLARYTWACGDPMRPG